VTAPDGFLFDSIALSGLCGQLMLIDASTNSSEQLVAPSIITHAVMGELAPTRLPTPALVLEARRDIPRDWSTQHLVLLDYIANFGCVVE
jgi:hypothetical protein